mmetsp:Transcript_89130/g.260557  ORF Transcript_89130/g.260557 Transcript_89130/m.260557 type:complete len:519 (+) Transcript_89130:525-2081(+)
MTAALALMQSINEPLSRTSACTSGLSVRSAREALSSTRLSLMKSSTCSRVGKSMPLVETLGAAGAAEVGFTPLDLMSRSRPMTAALALKQSTKEPLSITAFCTSAVSSLSAREAFSSSLFSAMKSSTPIISPFSDRRSGTGGRRPVLRASWRASLMRPMTAELGFTQFSRPPFMSTASWTSRDSPRKALSALLSMRPSLMNISRSMLSLTAGKDAELVPASRSAAAPPAASCCIRGCSPGGGSLGGCMKGACPSEARHPSCIDSGEKDPPLALPPLPLESFASLILPMMAALGFVHSATEPRSITARWTSGASSFNERAAPVSSRFWTIKRSTSLVSITPWPAATALSVLSWPLLAASFASLILPMTAELGFRQSMREPLSTTADWISGVSHLRSRAAVSSSRLSAMKRSTRLPPERPEPPDSPSSDAAKEEGRSGRESTAIFASRIRPMTAELGFRQSASEPRPTTAAWTSFFSDLSSLAALSSKWFSAMKRSTRSDVTELDGPPPPESSDPSPDEP